MDKFDPPTTFGVFKPVGHTVIALTTQEELKNAQNGLSELGFAPSSMVRYSPSEMKAQVEAQLLDASPFASFGYEIDLIRQHKILADQGCSFLVVEAGSDDLENRVAEWVRKVKPISAQHYGQLMIKNLTETPAGRAPDALS